MGDNKVNSNAMHTIAEGAAASQAFVGGGTMAAALAAFNTAAAGGEVESPAVPTSSKRGGAPMAPDALRVPAPDKKGPVSAPEAIPLADKNAPNPLAVATNNGEPQTQVLPPNIQPEPAAPANAAPQAPAAPPAVETPAAEPEGAARGWEEVKKAEKALVEQRTQFNQAQEVFKQNVQRFKQIAEQFQKDQQTQMERVRTDPFAVLAAGGWTMKSLMDYAQKVASGEATPTPAAEALPARPAPQPAMVTQESVQKTVQGALAVMQFRNDVKMELTKPEYAVLNTFPGDVSAEVEGSIIDHYQKTGARLTIADAARKLQDEYRDRLRSTVGHQAVLQALGLQAVPTSIPAPAPAPAPTKPAPAPRSITNSAATAPAAPPNWKEVPEHQRIAAVAQTLPADFWRL